MAGFPIPKPKKKAPVPQPSLPPYGSADSDQAGAFNQNPGLSGTKLGGAISGSTSAEPMNIGGIQQMLMHKGYGIPAGEHGKLGPVTKAAMRDFLQVSSSHPVSARMLNVLKGGPITGSRDAKAFNQKYGLTPRGARTSVVDKPLSGAGGLLDPAGNMSAGYSAAADRPTVDVSGMTGLDTNIGSPIMAGLLAKLNPKIGAALTPDMADKLAGLEYDTAIGETRRSQGKQQAQGAQDIADIKNWYNQVQGAQHVAGERDHAITEAGVGSARDTMSAVLASMGGSANQGSGYVASAGADQVGLLSALGANQDQYNADVAPLLKAEAAGASSRQLARNSTDASDIEAKLTSLLGERGAARAKHLLEITQYNNDLDQRNFGNEMSLNAAKQDVNKYNNSLDQQNFQNKLAIQQAIEAAAITNAKITGLGAKPAKGAFANTTAGQKVSVANGITSSITDANGNLKDGWTPQRATAFVDAQLRSAGWALANPAVQAYRRAILQAIGL